MPVFPTCGHRGNRKNCSILRMADVQHFHKAFYAVKTKVAQDMFLLKYCSSDAPDRHRPKNQQRGRKESTFSYYIENMAGTKLEVCRKTFLNVLQITKHRVHGVFKRFKVQGSLVPVETRGGYRKAEMYEGKIESVVNFIKKFKGCEAHYSRAKSSRIYLDSRLSIAEMWRMYKASVCDELQVKESFFRKIFLTRFNISFNTPSTDKCSKCLEFNERIKQEKNANAREDLNSDLSLHKSLAKGFFGLLKKEESGVFIISFDMQKNLPIPQLPDQITYYSRQLYCYNLSIVSGKSTGKSALSKENIAIYSWAEHQMRKSSNEIASAVFNELQLKVDSGAFNGIHTVRLVADGCPGQNKNTIILTMCMAWLVRAPPGIKKMEIVFPVTGHSYMPSDRVFGLIERELQKMENIIQLEEYHTVFKKYGSLKVLGTDWTNCDWKTQTKQYVKDSSALHFKISKVRKIVLIRKKYSVTVSGEKSYTMETEQSLPVLKKGKKLMDINPVELIMGVKVNPSKINDIEKLLCKHYGEKWSELEKLQWLRNVIEENEANPDIPDEAICECENLPADECNDIIQITL